MWRRALRIEVACWLALSGLALILLLGGLEPERGTRLWLLWFNGQDVGNFALLGTTVRVLGRWGKSLQIIAGLIILLDLFSARQLKRVAETRDEAKRYRYARLRRTASGDDLDTPNIRSTLYLLLGSAVLAVLALLLHHGSAAKNIWISAVCTFFFSPMAVFAAILTVGLIISIFFLAFAVLPYAAATFATHLFVYVFNRDRPGNPARVFALLLFLCGSGFDLLSS